MTEAQILKIVSEYFENHGYKPKRLDHKLVTTGKKSPDLELFLDNTLVAYCELKSPLLLLSNKTNLFQWTTTVSKLRNNIHDAVKQFQDIDSLHSTAWILVFTSDHMQLNWTNMTHCITGIVGYGKTIIKDLRKERYVRETDSDVKKVDLFTWFQMNLEGEIHQVRFFVNADSFYKQECEKITNNLRPRKDEIAYNK